ncbi:MAG: ferritin-like domain-containing protein [Aureispira sp.]
MKIDTLIIGSGVAGAAVAQKLLDKNPNASILMLEAGSKVPMRDFAQYQNYMLTGYAPYQSKSNDKQDYNYPQRDNPGENKTNNSDLKLRGARLMMYGGSTVHWGGWSFRLKPEDFNLYTKTGQGIDWPIDYQDLEAYYTMAEHYIGVAGNGEVKEGIPRNAPYPYPPYPYTLEDEPLREAFDSLTIGHNNMPIARHGIGDSESTHPPCQTTGTCKYCPFGARYVAANYLDDMKRYNDYPNFEIRKGAFVQQLLVDPHQKSKIVGVEYKDQQTHKIEKINAEQVILAAGAIESAKLLLRSKSASWPNGIGNDNDLVGRNLITHPYFIYQAKIPSNPDRLQSEMNFPTMVSRHFDSPEEQEKGKFILVSPPGSPDPINSQDKATSIAALMQLGKTRAEIDREVSSNAFVQIHGIIEVFSERSNTIRNYDKTNHLGLIETDVFYKKPTTFDKRIKFVEETVKKLFDKMGATDMTQVMMSWRADHAACLTRMSNSPTTGVVDKNLKVFGVDNLYVCSNASFSSLGAVNPTLTLTALALRLGDHLNGEIEAVSSQPLLTKTPTPVAKTPILNKPNLTIQDRLEELFALLQKAVELEFATIPPYLTAAFSLCAQNNRSSFQIIHSVYMEEMLHMVLAANIMNAIGGQVKLKKENIPTYPLRLEFQGKEFKDRAFDINLERFSKSAIDTFMQIELPDGWNEPSLKARSVVEVPGYTIGEFYKEIELKLKELCEDIGEEKVFIGDPSHQIGPDFYWSGGGKPFEVHTLEDALEAIEVIVEQGEGANLDSVLDSDHIFFGQEEEVGHFFRFNEILEGRKYKDNDDPRKPPTGDPFLVEWDQVYPIKMNCKAADFKNTPQLDRLNEHFNQHFTLMIKGIELAFNGQPKSLYSAIMNDMHGMAKIAAQMVQTPINGSPKKEHGSPSFEIICLTH